LMISLIFLISDLSSSKIESINIMSLLLIKNYRGESELIKIIDFNL